MATSATTPDNPFDTPLPSEVSDHQQASAAKVAAGGNPFDEPLPSEKAEAQAAAAPQTNFVPNARIRNLPNPAEGMTPGQALINGAQTGATLAAFPAAAAGVAGLADSATDVGASMLDKAKSVVSWATKNPLKATILESIAREMDVDPIQLAHKAIKYGKNLFGEDENPGK